MVMRAADESGGIDSEKLMKDLQAKVGQMQKTDRLENLSECSRNGDSPSSTWLYIRG